MRGLLALTFLLFSVQAADGAQDVPRARRLGQAYYEEGNYPKAAEQFRSVLRAQPGGGAFADHLNLGLTLIGAQDEEGALAALETARQMNPASAAPLYGLAILYKHQGRFQKALEYFQRAEKAGASDIATLFNSGVVLMSQGRLEEALGYFQRVLDRGVDFGPGWYLASEYRMSRLLRRLGRDEQARRVLRSWQQHRKERGEPVETAAMLELGPLAKPLIPDEAVPTRRKVAAPAFTAHVPHPAADFPVVETRTIVLDYDVDGDLDRLLIPAKCGRPRLERNNGPNAAGTAEFSDVTNAAQVVVPGEKGVCSAAVADFDNDGDTDIAVAGPDGAWLFSNLRAGKFGVSAPFGQAKGTAVATADLDADGAFDLVFGSSAGVSVWWNRGSRLVEVGCAKGPFALGDLNGDGLQDLTTVEVSEKGRTQLRFWLNLAGRRFQQRAGPSLAGAVAALKTAYLGEGLREGKLSLLARTPNGEVWKFDRVSPQAHWLRLNLEGSRSNKAGVGAVVEVKAGNFYTRAVVGAEPLTIETGKLERVDVVRVTWPNGMVQNVIETPTNRAVRVAEQDRLASSCPFLYLWDGSEFRYFGEVLSITPLGEPDGRGGFILPGSRENVFLPGEKMRPRDGRYVFQLTEELREAVYLDGARLVALDYPAGMRAFVDEAYRGAPVDIPMVALADLTSVPSRREPAEPGEEVLPGLLEQYVVNLELPPGADFLVLRGWTYWMDSNVATAASQNPLRVAVPPRLEARGPDGAWQTVVADLGLPSGRSRFVLADLRGRLGFAFPESRRTSPLPLRIVTNLRVSWDEILAGKVAGRPRSIERRALAADLHYRGFSLPTISPTRIAADDYDYSRLLDEAPWNAVPGRYTRYGNVLPLVGAQDDRLVVLAAGDELTLEFSAAFPPPPKGWQRDFVLELSGWVKAGEFNTASSGRVEPLPFRKMKQYPYRADSTADWQHRWLTRRPLSHLPPLAPAY